MAWEQLVSIRRAVAREADAERRQPPVACPHCGEPLDNIQGVLHCPAGDYTVGAR